MNQQPGKLNLVKADPAYYNVQRHPVKITLPPCNYLTLTGKGAPESAGFAAATEALYNLAYGIKNIYKQRGQDFVVAKLEGLRWVDVKIDTFMYALSVPREEWHWKLLIRQPDYVNAEAFEHARNHVLTKRGQVLTSSEQLHQVTYEIMEEGSCVQMLHQGPFADEPVTLDRIHRFIEEQGLTPTGEHHEIYLSDYRKTAQDKLRTMLRQPVK